MKPTDPVSLYNWEALNEKNNKDDETIKKRMETIWKKDYKTRY